ncbi:LysE family transporter [Pseudoalteromonas sp. CNC9-20]|uniref:LysE family transporter n=1 Tax=Pseudoalteromonas sp. CNC9-20 TaxID=2917750 RepID=UPI001EF4FD4F|nr:LysE family transporter [Pseudoalteromonas sp. CNC9-20]MCG7570516.1 LysE family transporter [Pseudoalteromonas sp. CNC9-20]|tara:strand:+ start:784 stop:1425 length:642 start_codon:yes stop_codon:yes gene_type:complete
MELSAYLPQLLSIATLATIMAISPGADFVMITRNSLVYGRRAGVYSALGVGLAIWIHVAYSIAGVALLIAQSVVLFTVIKYIGAAYLIYLGYQSLRAKHHIALELAHEAAPSKALSAISALRQGFITNALNPKTTLFFLSIFTQLVSADTPVAIQLVYGLIISLAHLLWFVLVAMFFSHFAFVHALQRYQRLIEKTLGVILMGLGVRVATLSQ